MLPIKKKIIHSGDTIQYKVDGEIKNGKIVKVLPRGVLLDNCDIVYKRQITRWSRGIR